MNQQIRKIAEQAGWSSFEALDERNEKFAKLLLRQAMQVCSELAEGYNKTANSNLVSDVGRQIYEGMWGGAKNCSATIAEQFGLEDEH